MLVDALRFLHSIEGRTNFFSFLKQVVGEFGPEFLFLHHEFWTTVKSAPQFQIISFNSPGTEIGTIPLPCDPSPFIWGGQFVNLQYSVCDKRFLSGHLVLDLVQRIFLMNAIYISSYMKATISASTNAADNSNLGIDLWIPDVTWLRGVMQDLDLRSATEASTLVIKSKILI